MKKTILPILFLILISKVGLSREFYTQTIKSKINDKTYTLFYHLPDNFTNSGQKYPVMFVLNCEWVYTSYIQCLKQLNLDQKVVLIGVGYGMGPNYKMINELDDYKVQISDQKSQFSPFKKVLLEELIPTSIEYLPIDNEQITIFGNRETSQFLTSLAFNLPEKSYRYIISNLEVEEDFVENLKESKSKNSLGIKFLCLINCDNLKKKQGKYHQEIINLYNTNSSVHNGILNYYSTTSEMPLHTSSTALRLGLANTRFTPIVIDKERILKKEFDYTIYLSDLYSKEINDTMLIYSFAGGDKTKGGKTTIVNLDSDLDFLLQVRICDSLSQAGLIGSYVLVGAGTGVDMGSYGNKRFRDLMHIPIRGYKTSGGGYDYQKFLSSTLIEHTESLYGKSTYKILCGHSLGGVFTAIASMDTCDKFDGYLISSPAFHVYKKRFISKSLSTFSIDHYTHNMFLSIGELEEEKKMKMVSDIIGFYDELIDKGVAKNRIEFKVYKNHNHVSVLPIAFSDGIIHLTKKLYEMPTEPKLH